MQKPARFQPPPPREILALRLARSTTGTVATLSRVITPDFIGTASPPGLPVGHIQNFTRAYARFPWGKFGGTMLPEIYHQKMDKSIAQLLITLSAQTWDAEDLRTLITKSYPHLATAGSLKRLTTKVSRSTSQQMMSPTPILTTNSDVVQLLQSLTQTAWKISGPQKDET